MGWFSWLKSSDKAVDATIGLVEKGASGIDMLFFTDEEKSIASAKIMDQVIAINQATADENSIRSRTRRMLAKCIVGNYLSLLNIGVLLKMLDEHGKATFVFKTANEALAAHVLTVVIFYFGYYGIKAVVKSVKDK
jgi:hypothetical protein